MVDRFRDRVQDHDRDHGDIEDKFLRKIITKGTFFYFNFFLFFLVD